MKKLIVLILPLLAFASLGLKDDCGSYRWSVKTLTDKNGDTVFKSAATPSTLAELIHETRSGPPDESDREKRYPDEFRKVRIEVTIVKIKMETKDHDFHIVLRSGKHTMVGEVPDGNCGTFEGHPELRKHFNKLRQLIISAIGFVPTSSLKPVDREVIIEGIPFWDKFNDSHQPTGSAENQHEIHPITKVTFK